MSFDTIGAMTDPFADALEPADRAALLALGRTRSAEAGELLLAQGDPSDRVLLLLEGRVKVALATRSGHSVVLAFRGPGALVGEQATIDGRPRGASVIAVERVELLVVAAGAFRRFLLEHPAAALVLIAELSGRLRDADGKRAGHVTGDTTARVASRLIELCEQYGSPDGGVAGPNEIRIELPMSQEELAGWSGASLEAAAKALRALRAAGWIETGRRRIVVRDLAALRARAMNP